MPLVPMTRLLSDARRRGYAVGYFESWNMESLCAVIEASEEESSPVIAGFGAIMMDSGWLKSFGLKVLGSLGRKASEVSKVPTAFIFNEATDIEQVRIAVASGFNTVSMDTSNLPLEENIRVTGEVIAMARPNAVEVEAELGRLPVGEKGVFEVAEPSSTDPREAVRFVRETGVDALAVSVGNVHVLMRSKASIDIELLKRIAAAVETPLVIHGGSGFPDEAIADAIRNGVSKFNVGSILKKSFYDGLKEATGVQGTEKSYLELGSRKAHDALSRGRLNLKQTLRRLMKAYGSSGRA